MAVSSVRLLPALAILALGGCATHITMDVAKNPPPAERFADFSHFELAPILLPAVYRGQDANEEALKKIQANVSSTMTPVLARWNAAGGQKGNGRTLLVEPSIREIKFLNATVRVWTGALSGSSAVILDARITEKETGRLIAAPEFYARAAAMGGAWTFGATDNVMLLRIANRLTGYLQANFDVAVGGPTGVDTPKK
ncbi:MAG TPA: hypothetical protein VHC86_03260 [Opitutaceae bacterium]|nr:hypothetical protein [Opitutaceae bacterium]